jgi:hypothetical protein
MFRSFTSVLSEVCVSCQIWLFSVVSWFRAFLVRCWGVFWMIWDGSSCPVITGMKRCRSYSDSKFITRFKLSRDSVCVAKYRLYSVGPTRVGLYHSCMCVSTCMQTVSHLVWYCGVVRRDTDGDTLGAWNQFKIWETLILFVTCILAVLSQCEKTILANLFYFQYKFKYTVWLYQISRCEYWHFFWRGGVVQRVGTVTFSLYRNTLYT